MRREVQKASETVRLLSNVASKTPPPNCECLKSRLDCTLLTDARWNGTLKSSDCGCRKFWWPPMMTQSRFGLKVATMLAPSTSELIGDCTVKRRKRSPESM